MLILQVWLASFRQIFGISFSRFLAFVTPALARETRNKSLARSVCIRVGDRRDHLKGLSLYLYSLLPNKPTVKKYYFAEKRQTTDKHGPDLWPRSYRFEPWERSNNRLRDRPRILVIGAVNADSYESYLREEYRIE